MHYIVKDETGCAMLLCKPGYPDGPANGLLLKGADVSLFSTRSKAREALRRTHKYSVKHELPWCCRAWKVRRAVPA